MRQPKEGGCGLTSGGSSEPRVSDEPDMDAEREAAVDDEEKDDTGEDPGVSSPSSASVILLIHMAGRGVVWPEADGASRSC